MRHIFHTCLLALRLISTVDSENAKNRCLAIFNDGIMNEAFSWIYVDPGTGEKRHNYKVVLLTPETTASA